MHIINFMRVEATKAMEEMQQQGIIDPLTSPWLSPVVLFKKKDGTIRFMWTTIDLMRSPGRKRTHCLTLTTPQKFLPDLNGFQRWL